MALDRKSPIDLVQRVASRRSTRATEVGRNDGFRRESFTLPRAEARLKAREWFDRYPKAAYLTEIEFWRELADGQIEFVMRRLPTAD
jgi:hypothetical protein